MALRAVKNSNSVIIADGTDFDQGGQNYHDQGVWCNWIYSSYPEYTQEILDHLATIESGMLPFCFKENATEDGIELRSLADIQNDPLGAGGE